MTTDLAAAIKWLEDNVTDAEWERLVGSDTREEFAAFTLDLGENIEAEWAAYAKWASDIL
jgi:hypothetical protein